MATKSRRPKARSSPPNAALLERLHQKRQLARARQLERDVVRLTKQVKQSAEAADQAIADLVAWTIRRRTGVEPTIEPNDHASSEV